MSKHEYSSDERPLVKYVQDIELAYIIQRYREIHDSLHVLLGYDTSVAEELAVKWYEMSILGLPSASLASFFGPLNVLLKGDISSLRTLNQVYLPHINSCLNGKEFFMNIYFEKEFGTDADELR